MNALSEFTEWVANRSHIDRSGRLPPGLRIDLHSRSDAHSIKPCELIVQDLLETCALLRTQAAEGQIAYGINYDCGWPNGKRKTLDLAIGIPLVAHEPTGDGAIHRLRSRGPQGRTTPQDQQFSRLLVACEAKSVLTEHHKSQPRIFDELNGSHAIVHAGDRDAIAAGITLINIASTFVSPLRQSPASDTVVVTTHHQPEDAARMVQHLRGLPRPIRSALMPTAHSSWMSITKGRSRCGRTRPHRVQATPTTMERS